jgi:uncharacterized membrane protein
MPIRTLGSFALGAAAMYFLDPRTGRRRRAKLRDQFVHAVAAERALLGKAGRDLEHRAHGVVSRLQNGEHPRAPAATTHEHLMPGPRVLVGGAGVALLAAASPVAKLGGAALLARAIANRPLRAAIGLDPTWIDVTKTITIAAAPDQVFALWSRPEGFPRFMDHVRSVQVTAIDPQIAQWVIDGPFGGHIAFATQTTRLEQGRLLAWQTLPSSQLEHAGEIHFDPVAGGTRVQIQLRYRPWAGLLGHALARILGCDPKSRLDQDLVRAKGLLERGHTRAHHQRVALEDVVPRYS